MPHTPDRKIFLNILMGSLGFAYFSVLVLVFRINYSDDLENISVLLGTCAFCASLMALAQYAMVAGNHGELEHTPTGWLVVQTIYAAAILGAQAGMWHFTLQVHMPLLYPVEAFELGTIAIVLGALLAVFMMVVVVRKLPRYRAVRFQTIAYLVPCVLLAGVGTLGALFRNELVKYYHPFEYEEYSDPYFFGEAIEICCGLSLASAFILLVWSIAPIAYLIVYRRAYQSALKEQAERAQG